LFFCNLTAAYHKSQLTPARRSALLSSLCADYGHVFCVVDDSDANEHSAGVQVITDFEWDGGGGVFAIRDDNLSEWFFIARQRNIESLAGRRRYRLPVFSPLV
jgi:hypothetical protein